MLKYNGFDVEVHSELGVASGRDRSSHRAGERRGVLGVASADRELQCGRAGRNLPLCATDPGSVVRILGAYNIKTIINLRGENIGEPWYDAEVKNPIA